MVSFFKDLQSFHGTISSEPDIMDALFNEVERYLGEIRVEDKNKILIVLRELVLNAIEHGNHKNVRKKVSCTVEKVSPTEFHITVGDEGEGFDYRKINMEIEEKPLKMEKRGYALIGALSDRLEFNCNGRSVTSIMTLSLYVP